MTIWVKFYDNGLDYIENRDGVGWSDAPLPPRFHRCFAQTRGFMSLSVVWRCPCGGARLNHGPWLEKNSSRAFRKKQERARRLDRTGRNEESA